MNAQALRSDDALRKDYWIRVDAALRLFDAPRSRLDELQRQISNLAAEQQDLFYHAEPFDVARDLAGVAHVSDIDIRRYRELAARHQCDSESVSVQAAAAPLGPPDYWVAATGVPSVEYLKRYEDLAPGSARLLLALIDAKTRLTIAQLATEVRLTAEAQRTREAASARLRQRDTALIAIVSTGGAAAVFAAGLVVPGVVMLIQGIAVGLALWHQARSAAGPKGDQATREEVTSKTE